MDKLPLITSVFLNLTNACNLKCRYCFVAQSPSYMSFDVAKDAADFVARNAKIQGDTPSINFFGGEPTLCWDSIIRPLTEYIRAKYQKFGLSMTSNCLLLDAERVQFLRDNNVNLLFSIDGDKETQDYNRPCANGESSFDILKDKIPLILSHYPGMTFRATIIPKTAEYTFKNIMFAINSGFKSMFFVVNAYETWDPESRAILQNNMRLYSDYFIDCFRSGRRPPEFSSLSQSFSRILRINSAARTSTSPLFCRALACDRCGLGSKNYAAIDTDGVVFTCQELVSNLKERAPFYIGDIYSGINDDLRQKIIDLYNSRACYGEHCSSCKLNYICDGRCIADNHLISGDMHRVPEASCWWANVLLDEATYIMNVLAAEKNEAFLQYWMDKTHGK